MGEYVVMSIGKKKGKKGSLGTSFIIEKVPGQKKFHVVTVLITTVITHVQHSQYLSQR